MPHGFYITFIVLLGASVGSFLNVVVWRLPRIELPERAPWWKTWYLSLKGLSDPPSHCPKCGQKLKWYDNVPVLGWIKLRGKCRFCRNPISPRYPIIEALTALLFAFYYVMYYMAEIGPCPPVKSPFFAGAAGHVYSAPAAPIFILHLLLLSALLAASLIDAELFIIPLPIPWTITVIAVAMHTLFDDPHVAGAVNAVTADGGVSPAAALGAGGTVGLLLSWLLYSRGYLKRSFATGEPLLEIDHEMIAAEAAEAKRAGLPPPPEVPEGMAVYTKRQIRQEMRHEMAFLLPPMAAAVLWWVATERLPGVRSAWLSFTASPHASGLLGALYGGLIGGFVVWLVRILGTLGFGRVAMGLGDVDLMVSVGAVLGAGASTVAFFLAPFFGLLTALYLFATGSRREMPYGPYLGMASAAVMLCYCPIEDWLAPGMAGLGYFLSNL